MTSFRLIGTSGTNAAKDETRCGQGTVVNPGISWCSAEGEIYKQLLRAL